MELITPRLSIREFTENDFTAIRVWDSDPEVLLYEGVPLTPEQTRYRLEGAIEWANEQPRVRYKLAITVRPNDRAIGRVSLTLNNRSIHEWEMGWTIRRADWGIGYATEAAKAVMEYAFTSLNAHRVIAFCHAENAASERVMQKLGMQREGRLHEVRYLNNAWCDELIYAILDHDFKKCWFV